MAKRAVDKGRLSIRAACHVFMISETCYRYQPKLNDENMLIADWLLGLTGRQRNWGFQLCFLYLRNVKGYKWNHKRVYRIYRELELNLRIKPRKRLIREKPEPCPCRKISTKSGQWILCMISYLMAAAFDYLTSLMTITGKDWVLTLIFPCPRAVSYGLLTRS